MADSKHPRTCLGELASELVRESGDFVHPEFFSVMLRLARGWVDDGAEVSHLAFRSRRSDFHYGSDIVDVLRNFADLTPSKSPESLLKPSN